MEGQGGGESRMVETHQQSLSATFPIFGQESNIPFLQLWLVAAKEELAVPALIRIEEHTHDCILLNALLIFPLKCDHLVSHEAR